MKYNSLYELRMYGEDGIIGEFFTTKREALDAIKKYQNGEYPMALYRVTVASIPRRELWCAMLNNNGFATKRETIKEWETPK
jgi:hypothetical protein